MLTGTEIPGLNIERFLEEFEVELGVGDDGFGDFKIRVLNHVELSGLKIDFELIELIVNMEHALVQ